MIIEPFTVQCLGDPYAFVDRSTIDSAAERRTIDAAISAVINTSQKEAMCAALGLPELRAIPNFGFGVYDRHGATVGCYLMASNVYVSGPWIDVVGWEETSNAPIVLNGRHAGAFGSLGAEGERELSAETTWHVLANNLRTVGGRQVQFAKISWAIFEQRTDAASMHVRGLHDRIVGDPRIRATMRQDDRDPTLTRVDVELA